MSYEEIKVPEQFSDICPISDSDFNKEMTWLANQPMFEAIVKYVFKGVNYKEFAQKLMQLHTKFDFQKLVMEPYLEGLVTNTCNGMTAGGMNLIDADKNYTYITNHRDIVLDASFLNLNMLKKGIDTTEVAIGNNLLVFKWISVLVRLNKSFIVKRNLSTRQRLAAAQQLSDYIHFAITKKHQSVWIAQREGRAKDSNDRTQESLIKMLAMGGEEKSLLNSIMELNLTPVAISYEYDPNDYLKATEFLMKHIDPTFKKSQKDDLVSMETGMLGYKGHVHFEITPCINEQLEALPKDMNRAVVLPKVAEIIDNAIHKAYKIYTTNYIAYDIRFNTHEFADKYTEEEKAKFIEYVEKQLDKVEVETTEEDREYMRGMMYVMYSNTLVNQLKATE